MSPTTASKGGLQWRPCSSETITFCYLAAALFHIRSTTSVWQGVLIKWARDLQTYTLMELGGNHAGH